jgi:hypothetical protein
MMNKELLKKIANQIHRPRPKFKAARSICPLREWSIGLLAAVIIIGGVSVWSFQEYIEHQSTTIHEIDDEGELGVVYRESMVSEALEKFTQRQKKFDELRVNNSYVPPVPEVVEEEAEEAEEEAEEAEEVPVDAPLEEAEEEVVDELPVVEEIDEPVDEPEVPEEESPEEPDEEDLEPTLAF